MESQVAEAQERDKLVAIDLEAIQAPGMAKAEVATV